ncbi:uncharacterized protein LOC115631848 [Scaptodrosophila lebanonensis]|uniref:Uncharacterized protein LOC115631848 n=1 Tax=Drosophila lebanonensis TaxID=7225 RepID=A0A6J2UBH4_DROLE|nr:uncharacterized protein LOC115631848 [Scaptodrosophila lebanonensis]
MLRFTALEYILKNISIDVTMRLNVLKEFLVATNNVELHNPNGFLLPINRAVEGANTKEISIFVEAFCSVKWHPVALLYWLHNLEGIREELPILRFETLCLLTESVQRAWNFREKLGDKMFDVFKKTIDHLSLTDFDRFCQNMKLSMRNTQVKPHIEPKTNDSENEEMCNLSKQFCNSFCPEQSFENCDRCTLFPRIEERLTSLLESVKNVSELGWLRFVIPFLACNLDTYLDNIFGAHYDFWSTAFELNRESIGECNFRDVQTYFLSKLNCKTQEEEDFVKTKCAEFFVRGKIKEWDDIHKADVTLEELLRSRSNVVICKLLDMQISRTQYENNCSDICKCFLDLKETSEMEIFDKETTVTTILKFLRKEDPDAKDFLEILKEFALIMPLSILWKCLRWTIEECEFELSMKLFAEIILPYKVSEKDLWDRPNLSPWKLNNHKKYISELVRLHVESTMTTPKYCRNSVDHRIKLRIGLFLVSIQMPYALSNRSKEWEEEWWSLVLAQFDELNVKMIYELFVAKWVSFNSLMKRLKNLRQQSPNNQLSIISVAHYFCRLTYRVEADILPIFNLLWDQIKDTTFDIRRLALLVIYTWIEKCTEEEYNNSKSQGALKKYKELGKWRQAIIQELGEELEDHRAKEIRLCLNPKSINVINDIFYLTFGPFEEYETKDALNFSNEYKKWRELFEKEAQRTIAFVNAEEEFYQPSALNKL